jgi:hypothetical protein
MDWLANLAGSLGKMPLEYLAMLVGLAAIGLAAFAIHAVASIAKGSGRK